MSMKLYAFKPEGHGPLSYFVMADSEEQARHAVLEYLRQGVRIGSSWLPSIIDLKQWEEGEQCMSVLEPGQVVINGNN